MTVLPTHLSLRDAKTGELVVTQPVEWDESTYRWSPPELPVGDYVAELSDADGNPMPIRWKPEALEIHDGS